MRSLVNRPDSFLPDAATVARLRQIIKHFGQRRAVLIGDMVADHYIYGRTSRISREAPVLIIKHQDEYIIPGQAANTANNIAALGARVSAIGIVGDDARGRELAAVLKRSGVPSDSLIKVNGFSTLTKTRILAGGHHTCRQQVIRIDNDEAPVPDGKVREQITARFKAQAARADVVVVSDYGYGLVDDELWKTVLQTAKARRCPVVLDSRYQLTRLNGATLVTPNEGEALDCCGLTPESDYDIQKVGRKLLKTTAAAGVIITRGNEGMAVFEAGSRPRHIGIFGSDQVTDVTGAGDTVVAACALAMAAGAGIAEAAEIATIAGGIVVMKTGTATLSRDELLTALQTGRPPC